MTTKCIVLGEESPLKGIELTQALGHDVKTNQFLSYPLISAASWDTIELICKNYLKRGFDLMFAYNESRTRGCLYFGHWNDGFVNSK